MNDIESILEIIKYNKFDCIDIGLLSFYSGYAKAYDFDLEFQSIVNDFEKYINIIGILGNNSFEINIQNNIVKSYHEEYGIGFIYETGPWIDNPTVEQICEMLRTFKERNKEN